MIGKCIQIALRIRIAAAGTEIDIIGDYNLLHTDSCVVNDDLLQYITSIWLEAILCILFCILSSIKLEGFNFEYSNISLKTSPHYTSGTSSMHAVLSGFRYQKFSQIFSY